MRGFTLTLLITLGLLLSGFAGFTLLVDPYDVVGSPDIAGFNARKTRTHEDGGRITASHRLLDPGAGTVLLGSSRVVDGFPKRDEAWPGGLINAGMRGTNAFELARAAVIAGRDPDLRCVVIGLDLDDFTVHVKTKATYWISTLPDGNRQAALFRMALSPSAFARALQTIEDNRTGGSDDFPFKDRYARGWQRAHFEASVGSTYRAFASGYELDPERVAFLGRAIDGLAARGVQVVLFIHPIYAWREEALIRSGRGADHDAMRRALAALAERHADDIARAPCIDGAAVQLWDFSGFQEVAQTRAPAPDAELAIRYWYEPAHYTPEIGAAILARLRGEIGAEILTGFGVPLAGAPDAVSPKDAANAAIPRRAAWARSDPDANLVARLIDEEAASTEAHEPPPRIYITRDDVAQLERDVGRLERMKTK